MRSLESAINHYEREAKYNEIYAEKYHICAAECRQFAEWLKELRNYKEERVGCEFCKHKHREMHERPCSLCKHNFMDQFEEEVQDEKNNNDM